MVGLRLPGESLWCKSSGELFARRPSVGFGICLRFQERGGRSGTRKHEHGALPAQVDRMEGQVDALGDGERAEREDAHLRRQGKGRAPRGEAHGAEVERPARGRRDEFPGEGDRKIHAENGGLAGELQASWSDGEMGSEGAKGLRHHARQLSRRKGDLGSEGPDPIHTDDADLQFADVQPPVVPEKVNLAEAATLVPHAAKCHGQPVEAT